MSLMRTCVLSLCVAAFLAGCQAAPAGTPTLDADSVIATAQAAAELTRAAVSPTAPPTTETPTRTATQAVTATTTTTPAPSGPTATASYNANVRDGPGIEYGSIDAFYQGQTATLVGRYVNGLGELWWYIHRIGVGLDGWVWDGAVVVTGDISGVPYLEIPPTPTSAPAPSPTPTP